MDLDTFLKEHEDLIAKSIDLLKVKNKDYSTDSDPLAGFKKIATDLGITPFQVWAVFASKHWQALTNFAKSNKVESEPIESRIIDMINYSVLLHLLIVDSKSWMKEQQKEFITTNKKVQDIRLTLTEYERNALDRVKGMTHLTPEVLKIYFNI